jgi:hypothetical protein
MEAAAEDEKKPFDQEAAAEDAGEPDPNEELILDSGKGTAWMVKVLFTLFIWDKPGEQLVRCPSLLWQDGLL